MKRCCSTADAGSTPATSTTTGVPGFDVARVMSWRAREATDVIGAKPRRERCDLRSGRCGMIRSPGTSSPNAQAGSNPGPTHELQSVSRPRHGGVVTQHPAEASVVADDAGPVTR